MSADLLARYSFTGRISLLHVQLLFEERDLFRLRFEIAVMRVPENEVQSDQSRLDVIQFMLLACAQILSLDGLVHLPGEEVIDTAAGPVRVISSRVSGPGVCE